MLVPEKKIKKWMVQKRVTCPASTVWTKTCPVSKLSYIASSLVSPTAVNPRLSLSKFIMPTNTTNNLTGTFIMTSVAGSMGAVSTVANEQIVGSTWRYKFSGTAANAVSGDTLTFQLTYTGGTQTIATWSYNQFTTNGNFHGEIVLFWSVIGAASVVRASGYVNYQNGTTSTNQNVNLNAFTVTYNTTLATNTNACQMVASVNLQFGVNNFTVEYLR